MHNSSFQFQGVKSFLEIFNFFCAYGKEARKYVLLDYFKILILFDHTVDEIL